MKVSSIAILLLAVCMVSAADKLKMDLNFESLCPGCGQVITSSMGPALEKAGFLDMVDFNFVAYGNASESQTKDGKWAFQCQHGDTECYGNAVDNCILKHIPDHLTGTKAVVCIEQIANVNGKGFAAALTQCGSKYNFDVSEVTACAKGDEGNALVHAAALRTPSDHKYVPWVVVNGSHPGENEENEIFDNVFNWACKNFKGTLPAGCKNSLHVRSVSRKSINVSFKKPVAEQIEELMFKLVEA